MHDWLWRTEAVFGLIVLLVCGILVELSTHSDMSFWLDLRSPWRLRMRGVISMVARFSKKWTLLAFVSIWLAGLHLLEQFFLFLTGKLDL